MKLIPEWRRVMRKAWSVRLMALAGVLTGCEAVIQTIGPDAIPVPAWARPLVVLGVIGGAFVARIMAQPDHHDD